MKKNDVRFFIDDKEVSEETFQEVPIDVEASTKIEDDYYESYATGRGSDAWLKTEYFL